MRKIYNIEEITIVEFEINSNCNLKCSYCPNSYLERKEKGTLDFSLYKRIINELVEIQFKGRISFDFFNEPLLNKDFFKYTEIVNNKLPDARLVLYTNGTLLTEAVLEKLFSHNFKSVVVTKHEGVDELEIDGYYNSLSPEIKSIVDYRNHSEVIKINRAGTLIEIKRDIKPLTPCYLPYFLISITNKGKFLPCFDDFKQELEMGDLNSSTLKEVWYSEKHQNFIHDLKHGLRHKHSACKNCNRNF